MKKKAKILLCLVLSAIVIFGISKGNFINVEAAKKIPYKDTKYEPRTVLEKTKLYKKNTDLGWHPQFKRYYKVDGYYFSVNKKTSYDVSLSGGIGPVSVSVNKNSASGGTFIKAKSSKWTRPKVYGDLYRTKVKLKYYDRDRKTVVLERVVYEYTTKNTYVKAVEKK